MAKQASTKQTSIVFSLQVHMDEELHKAWEIVRSHYDSKLYSNSAVGGNLIKTKAQDIRDGSTRRQQSELIKISLDGINANTVDIIRRLIAVESELKALKAVMAEHGFDLDEDADHA